MKTFSRIGITGAIALSVALLAGCGETPTKADKKPEISKAVMDAISAAKSANKKAASVGYEWRDTGKFIKKAHEAGMKGDEAKALKLANKAEQQAILAYKQYEHEKTLDRSIK